MTKPLMAIDTPIYDQMIGDGHSTGFDRYMTNTEANRAYAKEMPRWAGLMERLKQGGD